MINDQNNKLTPVQLEQVIIHLKSELEKYKLQTARFEKKFKRSNVRKLKQRNIELIKEIEILQKHLEDQEGKINMFRDQVERLEKEIISYKSHIEQLKREFENQLQNNTNRNIELKEKNLELEKEIKNLGEKINSIKTNQTDKQIMYEKQQELEIEKYEQKVQCINELERNVLEYEQQLASQNAELERYRNKEGNYQKEIIKYIKEIDDLKSGIKDKKSLYPLEIKKLQNELALSSKREQELTQELLQFEQQLASQNVELETLKENEGNYQKELKKYIKEIEMLKSIIEDKESLYSIEIEKLQNNLALTSKKVQELTQELGKSNKRINEMQALHSEELQLLTENALSFSEKEQKLIEEASRLTALLEEKEYIYNQDLQRLKNESIIFSKKEKELSLKIDTLNSFLKEKEDSFTTQIEQLNKRHQEKESDLLQQLKELNESIKGYKSQEELDKLEKEKLTNAVNELKKQLKVQEQNNTNLEKQVINLQQNSLDRTKNHSNASFHITYDEFKRKFSGHEILAQSEGKKNGSSSINNGHLTESTTLLSPHSSDKGTTIRNHSKNINNLSKKPNSSSLDSFVKSNHLLKTQDTSIRTTVDPFKKLRNS